MYMHTVHVQVACKHFASEWSLVGGTHPNLSVNWSEASYMLTSDLWHTVILLTQH